MKKNSSLLFLGKSDDFHTQRALSLCQQNFEHVDYQLGRFHQHKLSEDIQKWSGDYIISYLCPWIVPGELLKRAKSAALNFHPASPEYPGIGCNNFALYEGSKEYGATCHHMDPQVDRGPIVAVKRFKVFDTDTVDSLLARTHDHLLSLFYDVFEFVLNEETLPVSSEVWTKPPYTRRQLNELATISPSMSSEEVAKRVRATTFGPWKPTIEVQGFVFELKAPAEK